jgi:transposase
MLSHLAPLIAQARDLTPRRLGFIRAHTSEGLDTWLNEMRAFSLPAFVSFARSVERDKAAIVAGLSLPYSTGPVEGHITHFKRDLAASLGVRFLAVSGTTLPGCGLNRGSGYLTCAQRRD